MKDDTNLEDELNEALRYLGLKDWNVVWAPEPSEKARGLIIPEDKIILISDEKPEAAYDTLAHEYLEIRLQAMVESRNATINALLKALQEIYYKEKERGIDSLVPLVLKRMKERAEKIGDEGEG
ncbi:hypothetical protein ES703_94182 [subsurface metagenome]